MKINIFYSWQSDSPDDVNRDLIQDATQLVIEKIKSYGELEIEPVLDRDTQDIPGSPGIAQSILEKIDRSSLFLCDVTIVTQPGARRPIPNPNVLIELGYAAARLGWERIICVMNEEYGGPTKLPFDLQHRRWPIRYRLAQSASSEKRMEAREKLSESIELAVRSVIQSGILTSTVNPKDRRVAIKFENALGRITGTFAVFLTNHGYEDGMQIILQDHKNEAGSEYPPPSLVEPILTVLSQNTLKAPSHVSVGDENLPWWAAIVQELARVTQECDRILDQYADRDDSLISLVDEIRNRAESLIFLIQTPINTAQLTHLYDTGVPDVHIEWFRYFLLSILKSYRVIRQFK